MLTQVECNDKKYKIKKLLGHGKGGYSYLAQDDLREVVVKQLHHENCDYYNFGDKFKSELEAYNRLAKIGIKIPKLFVACEEQEILIKEYIEGETLAKIVAEGQMQEEYIIKIFEMTKKLYPAQINIDYFPTNFVVKGGEIYYIDYEYNNYNEEWNFENWGIYYLANKSGMKEFLDTGNALAINKDKNSGKPITTPFEKTVQEWLNIL